tara:strand:- start:853 stop:1749 length:897 start_codon:yes stop_codon:yes gene_type:complete
MNKYEKIFYKCLGFQTHKKYNLPLFFYHVPKCAGTTFVVLISHLFKKTHRLSGPLFKDNDKADLTAYENYLNNESVINSSNLDFLYGHLPFEIHDKLKNNYLFVATVREPIQRCISHYNWGINRGYYSIRDDIEDLFLQNKIPKNAIVNQFSGKGLSNPNCDESIELSLNNLRNKIDLLFDVEEIFKLLNLVISSYNLPNLFFQKQQVSYTKIKISKKTIETIKKYNEKDIILYSKLLQSKIIKNYSFKKLEKRNNKSYLYSSPYLLVNKQKTLLLNKVKIKAIEKELIKSNYKIQLV